MSHLNQKNFIAAVKFTHNNIDRKCNFYGLQLVIKLQYWLQLKTYKVLLWQSIIE